MKAAENSFIHRFIPGAGPNAADTLLLLHGTGGNENDLLKLGAELLPGASLLSPRGQVLENGMPRFFRRLSEGVFDLEDLSIRTNELADFVESACEKYQIDPARLTAVGYSNGANIAASVMLSRPETFSSAVLFRAMVPFVPQNSPDMSMHAVFLASGLTDRIIPGDSGRKLAAMFEDYGATVEMFLHRGGHELGEDDIQAAKNWLRPSK